MYYDQKESGKRIAALRKEKGLTQEQLAEKLNISTSTLGKIERGIQGFSIDLLIEIGMLFIRSGLPIPVDTELYTKNADSVERAEWLIDKIWFDIDNQSNMDW